MSLPLSSILSKLPVNEVVGSNNRPVKSIVAASNTVFSDDDILWVSDKNADVLKSITNGTVICSSAVDRTQFNSSCSYLIVDNPRLYFLNLVKNFFYEKEAAYVSTKSTIDATVKIGKNVTIHAGVVIEKNCSIGNDVSIDSNTVIKKNTIIGDRVKIGANNTIGGDGFGYEKNETGEFEFIPHIGNVILEEDVEVGNNTTIDRAVIGSTILRKNCKIDNLVHIAHGVIIGENSMIIANSMIAGSTIIGKNVWVAPSASVLNKVTVGDDAVIGMGAVVLKNVTNGLTMVGNPAKDLASLKKV
jgi:UDP-3-O-[3-hydroxymyristoyl] glucosamine N-acyltransferase